MSRIERHARGVITSITSWVTTSVIILICWVISLLCEYAVHENALTMNGFESTVQKRLFRYLANTNETAIYWHEITFFRINYDKNNTIESLDVVDVGSSCNTQVILKQGITLLIDMIKYHFFKKTKPHFNKLLKYKVREGVTLMNQCSIGFILAYIKE